MGEGEGLLLLVTMIVALCAFRHCAIANKGRWGRGHDPRLEHSALMPIISFNHMYVLTLNSQDNEDLRFQDAAFLFFLYLIYSCIMALVAS
jgi:hypothetical protein